MGDVVPDEDGWTEAYDAEAPRADMVKRASNGTSWLFMKSAENAAAGGMFSPDAVAALVKAGDDAGDALIKADYEALVKAKYSADQMRSLGAKGHAMSTGDGEYDYPIDDEEDLGRAIHAVGRGGADHDRIRAYVIRRARAMGLGSRIPEGWASDGSLKQPVAKSDGAGGDTSAPGSPAWEAVDADQAQQAITQLKSLRVLVQQLAAREGAEVGAGDMGDLDDVFDLQGVDDALRCALKTLAGFAAGELDAAAGTAPAAMAKAGSAKAGTAVHDTITKLAGACGCPVCAGFIAGAKQHSAQAQASQPPQDANDGPADTQQAPQPAAPKPMPAASPAGVDTPEQTMTKAATDPTPTPAGTDAGAAALTKAQKKIEKQKAKRIAAEAGLAKAAEENTALKGQLEELAKRVDTLAAQPAQGSGPAMNGAQPGATPLTAALDGRAPGQAGMDEGAQLLKSISDETDPVRKAGLQEQYVVNGLREVFSRPPTVAPAPAPTA